MASTQTESIPGALISLKVWTRVVWILSAIWATGMFTAGMRHITGILGVVGGPANGDSWPWAIRGLVAGLVLGIGQHLAGVGRGIGGPLPTGDSRRWAGLELIARWVVGTSRYFTGPSRPGWRWIGGTMLGAGIAGAVIGPLCFFLYWNFENVLPVTNWDYTTLYPLAGIGQWAWIPCMAVWGLGIGAGQVLAWRSRFPRPLRWVGLSSLTWAVATAVAVSFYQLWAILFPRDFSAVSISDPYFWVEVIIGVFVGLLQPGLLHRLLPEGFPEN